MIEAQIHESPEQIENKQKESKEIVKKLGY
jgi:hypothetical protein